MKATTVHVSRIRSALAALPLLAFLGVSSVALAAPFQASATRVSVVVKGDVYTSVITGQATQFGPFDGSSTFKIKGYRIVGTVVMVSNAGDELHFDVDATFTHDRTAASGTYVITGGTGRFSSATGSGSYSIETVPGVSSVARWEGTIDS